MLNPTLLMPKRKKPDPDDGYFLLRLPKKYRALLAALRPRTRRTMTVDTQIALERFAQDIKIDFTPDYPTFLRGGIDSPT